MAKRNASTMVERKSVFSRPLRVYERPASAPPNEPPTLDPDCWRSTAAIRRRARTICTQGIRELSNSMYQGVYHKTYGMQIQFFSVSRVRCLCVTTHRFSSLERVRTREENSS